jgi:hypothetical protein
MSKAISGIRIPFGVFVSEFREGEIRRIFIYQIKPTRRYPLFISNANKFENK